MSGLRFHVIKDPVHGTMQFNIVENAWIKPFIDSAPFQRLRHIKQLGMGDYIFPGAVHTRFNHSLGCCYVASQIAHKIGLTNKERQMVMIACLLHDIGHGPFSHAFEDIFLNKAIRHEDWTPYFLGNYQDPFFESYRQKNIDYPLDKASFQTIGQLITHELPYKNVLADIVSSQLDADRLDYLLRDSHFCGVRYGEFDFRWMLHCMISISTPSGTRLGITHKGIGSVEHYLMARRLMMRNIYQQQKKLAFEGLLVHLLKQLAQSLVDNKIQFNTEPTRLLSFLKAAKRFNDEINPKDFAVLKNQFLHEQYANYAYLCDDDIMQVIKYLNGTDYGSVSTIANRLYQRIIPYVLRIQETNIPKVREALNNFKAEYKTCFEDWQINLIDSPHQSYRNDNDPIYVLNERQEVHSLSHYSVMIQSMADRLENVSYLCIDRPITENKAIKRFIKHLQANLETGYV